jgi:hypothetical protein
MTHGVVPEAVRKLIDERIDSIPELEALLLLRQHRSQAWSADEAGQRLFLSTTDSKHVLSVLTERGLLARTLQRYQYAPESHELEADVTLLAETYSKHLIAVTNIVHAKPSPGTRFFSQSFRFRKDK